MRGDPPFSFDALTMRLLSDSIGGGDAGLPRVSPAPPQQDHAPDGAGGLVLRRLVRLVLGRLLFLPDQLFQCLPPGTRRQLTDGIVARSGDEQHPRITSFRQVLWVLRIHGSSSRLRT